MKRFGSPVLPPLVPRVEFAYLTATIRTDTYPPVVSDVHIFSEAQPTQIGFAYCYAVIHKIQAPSHQEARERMLQHVGESRLLAWCVPFLARHRALKPGDLLHGRAVR